VLSTVEVETFHLIIFSKECHKDKIVIGLCGHDIVIIAKN
jgi:hypothetical protein